jgi:hypothetical protein
MFAALAGLFALPRRSAAGTIALKGQLFATEEGAATGTFFTDPEGDSESLTLVANQDGFVHQWLKGSIGGDAMITIDVTRKK